ncbi:General stress protein A [Algoriella xinjiangensis]|uniref:glycosyltransferase family 8 protein n=1 Tax=Algoriella xinjiangensis TaxID=684065 RepID=UPI000F63C15B|nr:glycosyltransferase family 8 protein [Algoriella xinjiangensis]VDH17141.1 General stress protein A [Algoriella xinjiangensis]
MKFLPIVFTCDNNYFKYTAIVIKSILCNIDFDTKYEFNILSEDLSEKNKDLGKKMIQDYPNTSIIFINLEQIDKEKFYLNSYMNISTYYRFYIPEIFKTYERILYLDSDLIIDNSISFYATIDFENKIAITSPSIYIQKKLSENNDDSFNLDYFNSTLKMNDITQYFNAGVMLMNLDKIRNQAIDRKMFSSLTEIKEPYYQDQDLLNSVFHNNGGVKMISNEFNNPITYKITFKRLFLNAVKHNFFNKKRNDWFTIYHYVGQIKPWQAYKIDSNLFLYYAYKTPFISEIFQQNQALKVSKLTKCKLWLVSLF